MDPLPDDPTQYEQDKHLVYSYFDNKPNLSVYDGMKAVANANLDVRKRRLILIMHKIMYSTTENTLRIYFDS